MTPSWWASLARQSGECRLQMRSVQQDKHGLVSYVLSLGGSGRIDTTRAATKVSGKRTARSLKGGGQTDAPPAALPRPDTPNTAKSRPKQDGRLVSKARKKNSAHPRGSAAAMMQGSVPSIQARPPASRLATFAHGASSMAPSRPPFRAWRKTLT
jgi:hypothetical protein